MRNGQEIGHVLGRRVREIRRARGWSQTQLADRMKVIGTHMDRSTVAKVETAGRSTSLEEVLALAAALDCAPIHLILPTGDDEQRVFITRMLSAPVFSLRRWVRGLEPLPQLEGLPAWDADFFRSQTPRLEGEARSVPSFLMIELYIDHLYGRVSDEDELFAAIERLYAVLRDQQKARRELEGLVAPVSLEDDIRQARARVQADQEGDDDGVR